MDDSAEPKLNHRDASSLLRIDSTSPRRRILRQNPPVFLQIALLFGRHTNESGIKIFSPTTRFTTHNRLLGRRPRVADREDRRSVTGVIQHRGTRARRAPQLELPVGT